MTVTYISSRPCPHTQAVEAGAADAARRAAYEESKVKLRAAMADPTLRDELEDLDEVGWVPSVEAELGGGGVMWLVRGFCCDW